MAGKASLQLHPKSNIAPAAGKEAPEIKSDINTATAEELSAIRGIGKVLSERIVKFRKRLGGFLIDAQLYDVYGLKDDVVRNPLQHYTVLTPPKIQKININTATVEALAAIAYLRYKDARAIVMYREDNGKIQSLDELTKIPDFPIEKIDRIKLYLTL